MSKAVIKKKAAPALSGKPKVKTAEQECLEAKQTLARQAIQAIEKKITDKEKAIARSVLYLVDKKALKAALKTGAVPNYETQEERIASMIASITVISSLMIQKKNLIAEYETEYKARYYGSSTLRMIGSYII